MRILKTFGLLMFISFSINIQSQSNIDYNKLAKLIFKNPGKVVPGNLFLVVKYNDKKGQAKQLIKTEIKIKYLERKYSKSQLSRNRSKRKEYNNLVLKKRELQKNLYNLYHKSDHNELLRKHNKKALEEAFGL
ncbi:hypothetical protein [Polaribacter uvawellassae]|uniref:hypothetical protein n=1 Tax=Polaribacter uvawellassae TaxID=3133495 RepID=UPI00321ADD83